MLWALQGTGNEGLRQANLEGLPLSADTDGLLSQALLLGKLGLAVELCLKEERFADAIILAQAGGADLLKRTQERYLAKKRTKISSVTSHQ
jgi:protein transport protein SEC31